MFINRGRGRFSIREKGLLKIVIIYCCGNDRTYKNFNSDFAEKYCLIMVIYYYGNFILYILSAFMVIRIAK